MLKYDNALQNLLWGTYFGAGWGDSFYGDGVKGVFVDSQGNVWVTGPRGLWVISSEGEHLGVIGVPENVGNIAWGGPDWKTLYIPSSTSVYRLPTKVASTHLPYH